MRVSFDSFNRRTAAGNISHITGQASVSSVLTDIETTQARCVK
jgi:hypothetical protein